MGCFWPVPRVCRVRVLARGLPEEWLHRRASAGQNPAYRPSGQIVFKRGRTPSGLLLQKLRADAQHLRGNVDLCQKIAERGDHCRHRRNKQKRNDRRKVEP